MHDIEQDHSDYCRHHCHPAGNVARTDREEGQHAERSGADLRNNQGASLVDGMPRSHNGIDA